MRNNNILSLKLKIFFIAEFAAVACFFPFLTYYFQQRGLSYTEIGIAYAIYSLTGVIAQPIWGIITDKYSNKKTSIIITMSLSSLIIYNFIFAKSFHTIALSLFLLLSFQSSVAPLGDAYCYEIIDHHRDIQYGKIRLMGSLGYALAALLLGLAVKYSGINTAFIVYSISMLLGAIIVFNINYKDKTANQNIDISDFVNLIKDKKFLAFMLMIGIAYVGIGSNSSFIAILIQKTGGDVSQLGLLWFVMAISEVPAFFFGAKLLKRFGDLNLYIIGMTLFTLRYFLDSLCVSFEFVIIIQLMQGITYTLFILSSFKYLYKITPKKMKASSMTFFAAVCGTGGFIGSICGGMLLEHISIFILYKIIASMCLISLFGALLIKNKAKGASNKYE